MLSEQVSGAGNKGDPYDGAQKVEDDKCPPAHAQDAGERSGDNAHAEDEASEENCSRAISGKERLPALEHAVRNAKEFLIAIEQWAPAVVADGESQVVAERGGTGGEDDNPSEMKFVLGE